jgi:ATP-dependent RNA helicase RhlE
MVYTCSTLNSISGSLNVSGTIYHKKHSSDTVKNNFICLPKMAVDILRCVLPKSRSEKSGPAKNKRSPKTNKSPETEKVIEISEKIKKSFGKLGLSQASLAGASKLGFDTPTKIQKKVVPEVSAGKDLVACSETGSGKTASFVLPILDLLSYRSKKIQALVLVPTRELCQQVADAFRELGEGVPLKVAEIYGGMRYSTQRNRIAEHPQVVVGAPGRVLDLLGTRDLDFRNIKILVLDEADRMLDMGFFPQISEILKHVPKKRQNLMFSATMPAEVKRFASICLTDPTQIVVGERAKPPKQVVQEAVEVMPADKEEKLVEIVAREKGSILIFSATKVGADSIYNALKNSGQKVCVIHSDRNQNARHKAIEGFGNGKYRIMVATDVAQRGLDIEGISIVINYDLPNNPEDYVHRIGRTGRASAAGRAITFVTYKDYADIKNIERVVGHTFKNLKPASKSLDRRSGLKRKIR